jgi:hypothetical protein
LFVCLFVFETSLDTATRPWKRTRYNIKCIQFNWLFC